MSTASRTRYLVRRMIQGAAVRLVVTSPDWMALLVGGTLLIGGGLLFRGHLLVILAVAIVLAAGAQRGVTALVGGPLLKAARWAEGTLADIDERAFAAEHAAFLRLQHVMAADNTTVTSHPPRGRCWRCGGESAPCARRRAAEARIEFLADAYERLDLSR